MNSDKMHSSKCHTYWSHNLSHKYILMLLRYCISKMLCIGSGRSITSSQHNVLEHYCHYYMYMDVIKDRPFYNESFGQASFVIPFFIIYMQGILDRLSNIEDVASVGWIQVDQRPIKQALTALAAKWKYTYASHLERQVHVHGILLVYMYIHCSHSYMLIMQCSFPYTLHAWSSTCICLYII